MSLLICKVESQRERDEPRKEETLIGKEGREKGCGGDGGRWKQGACACVHRREEERVDRRYAVAVATAGTEDSQGNPLLLGSVPRPPRETRLSSRPVRVTSAPQLLCHLHCTNHFVLALLLETENYIHTLSKLQTVAL